MAWITPTITPTTKQVDTPAAATAAVVTIAAPGAGYRTVIKQIEWSYNAAPTGGNLTITSGGTPIMNFDITAAGPAALVADIPANNANEAMVVTLASGAGAVVGKLTVHSFRDTFAPGVVASLA